MRDQNSSNFQPTHIATAIGLLTRIPVAQGDGDRLADSAWAWPLAGLVIALVGWLVAVVAGGFGLDAPIRAGLALAAIIALTGAMHEDGLADSIDGFWGGWDRDRRLEIMHDSRIGTFGVLALVVTLLLRWAALTALFEFGHVLAPLVAAAAMSRAGMALVSAWLPNARGDGLSHAVGRPEPAIAWAAAALALLLALLVIGWAAAVTAIVGLATVALCGLLARARIGGQTGDVLGMTQVLAETAMLAALSAILP